MNILNPLLLPQILVLSRVMGLESLLLFEIHVFSIMIRLQQLLDIFRPVSNLGFNLMVLQRMGVSSGSILLGQCIRL
jgi:hypothetical protein